MSATDLIFTLLLCAILGTNLARWREEAVTTGKMEAVKFILDKGCAPRSDRP